MSQRVWDLPYLPGQIVYREVCLPVGRLYQYHIDVVALLLGNQSQ
jgi:hypothetical protein